MQWLQQDDEFDGVRYETAVDYSEMRFAGGHNLAFVTKDFDSEGYAQELRKCMGMLEAVGEVFPGAKYQRCTVHFYRNVFSVVPKSKIQIVAKMLKAIHA